MKRGSKHRGKRSEEQLRAQVTGIVMEPLERLREMLSGVDASAAACRGMFREMDDRYRMDREIDSNSLRRLTALHEGLEASAGAAYTLVRQICEDVDATLDTLPPRPDTRT